MPPGVVSLGGGLGGTSWTCLGEGGEGGYVLGCEKHLLMIELMVVLILLMTFTPMVSMVLVLRGVGPILSNGYGI